MYASTHEDTDDAYVSGYTHQISSRITGTVQEVLVDDNWHVTAGQPLLKLDPRDYQVALQKDEASYLQAQAQLLQAIAQIPLSRGSVSPGASPGPFLLRQIPTICSALLSGTTNSSTRVGESFRNRTSTG